MKVRSSKEQSTNEHSFRISCDSYLEWAGKKNADKKIKTAGFWGPMAASDPDLILGNKRREVL